MLFKKIFFLKDIVGPQGAKNPLSLDHIMVTHNTHNTHFGSICAKLVSRQLFHAWQWIGCREPDTFQQMRNSLFCWHYNTRFARESDVWMTWKGGNNVSLRNAKAPWDIFLRVSLQHEYELHTGKQTHTDAYCGHKSLLDNFRSCFSHLSFSILHCMFVSLSSLVLTGLNREKRNITFCGSPPLKTNPKCDWIWRRAKEFKRGQKIDVLEKLLAGLEQVGVGGLWGLWKTNDRTNTFGRTTTRGMIQWDKGW